MKRKAVFLDRDGNINRDVGYPDSYQSIHIYPFAYSAIKKLNAAGFLSVIVTNQSGIGRGLIKEINLKEIHSTMVKELKKKKAQIDGVYYCPHHPYSLNPEYKKNCLCRKPAPGMALKASEELNIDLTRSYMIGDKVGDILFGFNIGAIPILVLTGYGKKSSFYFESKQKKPAYIAQNLEKAVDWIILREQNSNNLS